MMRFLPLLLLLLLTTAAYVPGLSGGFVFDDFPNIVDNPDLWVKGSSVSDWLAAAFSGGAGPLSRPLAVVSSALEIHLFGLNPWVMKLTNLIIHLANVVLVFVLMAWVIELYTRRTQTLFPVSARVLALLVAASWALAPINLTSVLYVVQRMESLATLFMLFGLLAYVHGRDLIDADPALYRRGWGWILFGLFGCGLLAALSKESGVMLPVYAALLEWLLFGWGSGRLRRHLMVLYGGVLVFPGVLGLLFWIVPYLQGGGYGSRSFTLPERLWTEARVVWDYLRWIVIPTPDSLSLYHDDYPVSRGPLAPLTSLLGALGLAVLATVAVWARRRTPLVTLGILWFFVMHLLVSTVVPLELVYEHRNYLGSVGVFLAIYVLLASLPMRAGFAVCALALITLPLYAGMTFLRASEWGEPMRHAYFESSRKPESPRATYEFGMQLVRASPEPESEIFEQAIASFTHAATLPNTGLLPLQALLFLYGKHGLPVPPNLWNDMRGYIHTRSLSAQDINALYGLLNAQVKEVIQLDTAALGRVYEAAYEAHPRRAVVVTFYANYLLNAVGRTEEAGPLLQRATALSPRNPQMWVNLARYQFATGQFPQARASLERLRELNRFGSQDLVIAELEAMDPAMKQGTP